MVKIPFLKPPFSADDRYAAYKMMGTANVSTGPEIGEFERQFKEYIGCNHALSVCNGTIALELIWQTFIRNGKLKKGDKVLVPSFTFVAVANSIVNSGLVPVFCDIDPETWNIDIYTAPERNIKAICAVHTFGNPCSMEDLFSDFARWCIIVEDCAEACGAEYRDKKVGSFGDAASFSFNATKNLTTGEGGMCCFKEQEDANIALLLKENGFGYTSRNAIIPGHNYRLSNIQCAVGLEQLKYLDLRNVQRKMHVNKIRKEFDNKMFQKEIGEHVYQIFGMLVEDRDKVYEHMIKSGIECKKYFSPHIAEQEYYHNNYIFPDFPGTDKISESIICLPMYPQLTDEDIEYMVNVLKEVI